MARVNGTRAKIAAFDPLGEKFKNKHMRAFATQRVNGQKGASGGWLNHCARFRRKEYEASVRFETAFPGVARELRQQHTNQDMRHGSPQMSGTRGEASPAPGDIILAPIASKGCQPANTFPQAKAAACFSLQAPHTHPQPSLSFLKL